MNKFTVWGLALFVVLGILIFGRAPDTGVEGGVGLREIPVVLSPVGLPQPNLNLPFSGKITRDEAWAVFEEYIEAAKNHDLDRVRALSYELSAECQSPERIEECKNLMDSVVFFLGEFEKGLFANTESDSRQAVLYSDYEEENRILLYFVRTNTQVQVLGARFCSEGEGALRECFDNREESREDSDGDGWWDGVEASFR